MKFFLGVIIGSLLTITGVTVESFLNPTKRDYAILISIRNDTNHAINLLSLKSNQGQLFSCSLANNSCSIGIINAGDSSFIVTAELASGKLLKTDIGYADSGSTHELLISQFTE